MLDVDTQTTPKTDSLIDYSLNFNNIEALKSRIKIPRENVNKNTSIPTPDEEADQQGSDQTAAPGPGFDPFAEEYAEEPDKNQLSPEQARTQARFFAEGADKGISLGVAMYAKEKESRQFQAEASELNSLTGSWQRYLEANEINLSPGAQLIYHNLLTYGPKIYTAFHLRMAKLETEQSKMKKDIDDLKKKEDEN